MVDFEWCSDNAYMRLCIDLICCSLVAHWVLEFWFEQNLHCTS